MTKQRKINIAERLIQIAENLLESEVYFKSKVRRNDLAGYYKEFLYLDSNFPSLPGSRDVADKLQKRISKSCPACVTPQNMKIYIMSAITYIEKYGELLKVMIEEIDNPPLSVHDLTPRK